MSIAGQCPSCSRKFNAPDQYAGKSVKCPQCAQPFVMGAANGSAFAFSAAPGPAPSAAVGSAYSTKTPASGGGSSKRLLIIGGIAAAGFVLLVGVVGIAGLYWYRGGGDSQWKEFAPKDAGFTVLMPGAPAQKDKSDPKIVSATPIHEALAQPAGSKITYSVQYYDLAAPPINDYLYLSWLKHHLLSAGGKLTEEHDLKPEPYYGGKEVIVRLPDNQVVVRRLYLAEARVFWVTAQYPDAPVPPAEIQKFLDSFKITSVAKAQRAPTAVAEAPKSTKKEEPPVTKKNPEPPMTKKGPEAPPPPDKGAAAVSTDEDAVVQAVNRFRAEKKVPRVTADKKLAEIARDAARARAENKVGLMPNDLGFGTTFIQPIEVQGGTVADFVDMYAKKFQRLGDSLANPKMQAIGVGIATAKDGKIHGILLFGGNAK